ncbi:MAG: MBL fold metallo-hydrolase [Flavobacteriaceae bacterium]|nr:MBL fold metallo-hydrolase [Flavobacteriaceae bacterium]
MVCSVLLICSCENSKLKETGINGQFIQVLGVAQDGGYPHINYDEEWKNFLEGNISRELVVSLGLIDKESGQRWLFEATPDMPRQLHMLNSSLKSEKNIVDGVFLTHAHIGHYTGLMYFGREAMGARGVPVFAMPKMKDFLENNGPWSQLVTLKNIEINPILGDSVCRLNDQLSVIPFTVPHRDEFSETVGFKIMGPERSALFIPDINKWELWERSIIEEVRAVDYAFLDATFFKDGEINRPMTEVPHPFIEETMSLFQDQPEEVRSKIIFIHFNHSNPVLWDKRLGDSLNVLGYRFAKTGDRFPL